jgi:isopenicillin N synthase-like dioxygenase
MGSDFNEQQPNQWIPNDTLPGFREFMSHFYWECSGVASDILRALAVGIGLDNENHLVEKHSGHNNQLRLLHYPSVPAEALERQAMARMPAHTDWSSMTMLFQDDCGGLEVEDLSHRGQFVPAPPIKNAIIMNVGDLLQRWSNGTFPRFPGEDSQGTHAVSRLSSINEPPSGPPSDERSLGRAKSHDPRALFHSLFPFARPDVSY